MWLLYVSLLQCGIIYVHFQMKLKPASKKQTIGMHGPGKLAKQSSGSQGTQASPYLVPYKMLSLLSPANLEKLSAL